MVALSSLEPEIHFKRPVELKYLESSLTTFIAVLL